MAAVEKAKSLKQIIVDGKNSLPVWLFLPSFIDDKLGPPLNLPNHRLTNTVRVRLENRILFVNAPLSVGLLTVGLITGNPVALASAGVVAGAPLVDKMILETNRVIERKVYQYRQMMKDK